MLEIVTSVLIQTGGGLLIAIAVSALSWNLFKVVRHPELGPWIGLAALLLLLACGIRADRLISMATFFLLILAFGLWPAGIEWRNRNVSG